jgi:hypothetical protein
MKVEIHFTGFEQKILFDGKPFYAKIYEGKHLPPQGFNVLNIPLDLSERSLLNWNKECQLAQKALEKGLLILWELQFDLSDGPLEDEARFLTFQLNMQHFIEVLWKPFRQHAFGVAFYRGYLQEGFLDYLKSLAALLDEEACCFLFLDLSDSSDLKSYLLGSVPANLGCFFPIIKGQFSKKYPWAFPALAWDHGASSLGYCASSIHPRISETLLAYAICLPEKPLWEQLEAAVHHMGFLPFRILPESLLTQEWEGVDKLIIFPEACTEKSMRKFRGFMAAGGEIIEFPSGAASLPLQETSQPFCPVFLP